MPVRVGHEVDHDPFHPARVGLHHLGVPGRDEGRGPGPAHDVGDQLAERHRVGPGPFGPGVEPGDFQQVLDQPVQGPGPVAYESGGLVVLREQSGGGGQAHQRGAQFVCDVRRESPFALQFALQGGGHLVHGRRHLGDLVPGPAAGADPGVEVAVGDGLGGTGAPAQPAVHRLGGQGGERYDDQEGGEHGLDDAAVQELQAAHLGAHVRPRDEHPVARDGHGRPQPVPVGGFAVVPSRIGGVRVLGGQRPRERRVQLLRREDLDVERRAARTGVLALGGLQPRADAFESGPVAALRHRLVDEYADHRGHRAAGGRGQGGDLPAQGARVEECHVPTGPQSRTSL